MNSREDYVQAGTEALIRAKTKYNQAKGSAETFAKSVVMNALRNYTRSDRRHDLPNKVGTDNISFLLKSSLGDYLPQLNTDEQNLLDMKLQNKTLKEIALDLDLKPKVVQLRLKSLYQKIQEANYV